MSILKSIYYFFFPNPEKCIHLWEHHDHHVKCMKCKKKEEIPIYRITATGGKTLPYIKEGYRKVVNGIINERQDEVNELLKVKNDEIERLKKMCDRSIGLLSDYYDEFIEEYPEWEKDIL